MRSYHPAKFLKIWIFSTVHNEKFKFSQILLGDNNATYLCSRIIPTLPTSFSMIRWLCSKLETTYGKKFPTQRPLRLSEAISIILVEIWKAFSSHMLEKNYDGLKNSKKRNGILFMLQKLFWPTVRKNCSSDREKLSRFEAEGREFAKILKSVKQFVQTVKVQNNF